MTPVALLQALADKAGLEALPADRDGSVAIMLGERVALTFRLLPDDEALVLFSVLGSLPVLGAEPLLRQLLRGNRFGRETGGATLSLDDAEPPRALLVQRFDTRHLEAGEFVESVEGFADIAGRWMQRLDLDAAPDVLLPAPAWALPGSLA